MNVYQAEKNNCFAIEISLYSRQQKYEAVIECSILSAPIIVQKYGETNCIITLQKKAIRILTSSNYLATTDPLFVNLNISKFTDIVRYTFYFWL